MVRWTTSGCGARGSQLALFLVVTLVSTLLSPLVGCAGTPPPDDSAFPTVTPRPAAGVVDTSEVGGQGLSVWSALAPAAPVAGGGEFATEVSDIGAQAIFVVDGSGEVRGIGLSVPGATGAVSRSSLAVDAESTALGLLLMVPGITALGTDTVGRIAEIRELPSFSAFVTYLEGALPFSSLDDLNAQAGQYPSLYAACVEEWLAAHPASSAALVRPRVAKLQVQSPPTDYEGGMEVTCPSDPASWTKADVTIANGGWRFVDIRRRDMDEAVPRNWAQVAADASAMAGVSGFSWGALFTASFDSPTSLNDTVDFASLTRSEYWVRGPGFKEAYANMPAGAPGVGNDPLTRYAVPAWGVSIVMYLALPIIGLVAGVGDLAKASGKELTALATELWQTVSGGAGIGGLLLSVTELVGSADNAAKAKAVIEVVLAVLGIVAATPALAAGLGLAAYATTLAAVLAAASAPLCLANAVICVGAWSQYPWCTYYTVRKPTHGVVLKAEPTVLKADGRTLCTVVATTRQYAADQDPATNPIPLGNPVEGVSLLLSTTLGTITESGELTYATTSGPGGEATCHILSSEKGTATVSAVDQDGGASCSVQVHFTGLDLPKQNAWARLIGYSWCEDDPSNCTRGGISMGIAVKWNAVPGADRYRVTLVENGGATGPFVPPSDWEATGSETLIDPAYSVGSEWVTDGVPSLGSFFPYATEWDDTGEPCLSLVLVTALARDLTRDDTRWDAITRFRTAVTQYYNGWVLEVQPLEAEPLGSSAGS